MIESYATDAALCVRHGGAARQRAIQHFSLQSMVAHYQDVYETL